MFSFQFPIKFVVPFLSFYLFFNFLINGNKQQWKAKWKKKISEFIEYKRSVSCKHLCFMYLKIFEIICCCLMLCEFFSLVENNQSFTNNIHITCIILLIWILHSSYIFFHFYGRLSIFFYSFFFQSIHFIPISFHIHNIGCSLSVSTFYTQHNIYEKKKFFFFFILFFDFAVHNFIHNASDCNMSY